MNLYSAIGAGAAYFIVSLFAGRLLPVFHVATIIAVVVGGIAGAIIGGVIEDKNQKGKMYSADEKRETYAFFK